GVPGDRSIRKVRLSCNRGAVIWRQPIGAIHVHIDVARREGSQLCFRPLPEHTKFVSILRVEKNKLTPLELRADEIVCIDKNVNSETFSIFLQSTNPEPWKGVHVAGFKYEVVMKRRSKRVFEGWVDANSSDLIDKSRAFVDKLIRRPMLYAEILKKEPHGRLTAVIEGCVPSEGKRLFIARTRLGRVHVLCSPLVDEFRRLAYESEGKALCQLI
ncbi:unnamed protein product, partial [Toxocara canis]|uniref:SHR-BD domain-containing protein n=1 Tax=Toxocara canis TaxID=6265 RepID=A0A183UUF2_TOXCA